MAQTQKKQQDMGTGDVKKLLLQLMIPAVVAQVVNLLYNTSGGRPQRRFPV